MVQIPFDISHTCKQEEPIQHNPSKTNFQFWKSVSISYYIMVNNTIENHITGMLVKEKKQILSSIIQEKRLEMQSNASYLYENDKSISKKLTSAIIESERRNDEMIHKIQQEGGINQTISCIVESERKNDEMINNMINDLPHYRPSRSDIQGIYFPYEMSAELLLQLR